MSRQTAELHLDRFRVCICTTTASDGHEFSSSSAAEMGRIALLRRAHGQTVYVVLFAVKRTARAMNAPVQHVRVDHRAGGGFRLGPHRGCGRRPGRAQHQ